MTPKKHFAKSTTAVEGFAHVVNDLKIDVPKAAAELEKNPPRLVQAATSPQTPAPPSAGAPPTPQQHLKGVVFSKLGLAGTHYEQALDTVLSDIGWAPLGPKVKFDRGDSKHWALLGVKDLKDFAAKTQRALTQDPTHAVTPETGVGNYFETVGWDLPETKFLVTTVFQYLRDDVYAAAGVEGALRNGLNQPIKLQSRFAGPLQTMENTHIFYVENGREVHGGKFVDRLPYQVNGQGQILGLFGELKGITASKELTPQMEKVHGRLQKAMERKGAQAFIKGTVNGVSVPPLPIAQFVLLVDPVKAGRGRVGVRAAALDDPRWDVTMHQDSLGSPYVRLAVVCRTTFVREVYIRLYRELGL